MSKHCTNLGGLFRDDSASEELRYAIFVSSSCAGKSTIPLREDISPSAWGHQARGNQSKPAAASASQDEEIFLRAGVSMGEQRTDADPALPGESRSALANRPYCHVGSGPPLS